jgi:hypothetical protein
MSIPPKELQCSGNNLDGNPAGILIATSSLRVEV